MTEMQSAFKILGYLPTNQIIKNPAGTFSFVGQVDMRLCYQMKDGSPLTDEMMDKIRNFGAGLFRKVIESRVYLTKEDAEKALEEYV